MMKLKYLFDNRDLAKMLVDNWKYDEDSLHMFDYFRISSNAIYPFQYEGKTKLLRFTPTSEKDKNNVLAELEFICYLSSNGYPALKTVLSKNSEELVEAQTPWGEYYATVFDRVKGVQIEDTDFNDNIMFEYGKTLGKLHKLSSSFKPILRRWSYEDILLWIHSSLKEFENQEVALNEVTLLQAYFSNLPKTTQNYGLVHYDFDLDNVFYDEASGTCNVIDFDDAMYHWYAMDIEQTLDSIKEEVDAKKYEHIKECFLNGYRNEYEITDEMLSIQPIFRRFANLYSYTRVLRACEEVWNNEPEWLIDLRIKLNNVMKNAAMNFDCDL